MADITVHGLILSRAYYWKDTCTSDLGGLFLEDLFLLLFYYIYIFFFGGGDLLSEFYFILFFYYFIFFIIIRILWYFSHKCPSSSVVSQECLPMMEGHRFPSGTRIISLSHARDMMNITSFSLYYRVQNVPS